MKSPPPTWLSTLGDQLQQPYYARLASLVDNERANQIVFPADRDVFRALELVAFEDVRVLMLGQDPYHGPGQADGLCFSVRPPTAPPPSLRNLFKELKTDLGIEPPEHGDLSAWATQGVLLLNSVLTVRAHQPASHSRFGWQQFTDAIIRKLSDRQRPVVFCLLGAYAKQKLALIDRARHPVFTAAHPSPLSQKKFFGSKPFSTMNRYLADCGQQTIDWRLC